MNGALQARYADDLARAEGRFQRDPAQLEALRELERIAAELCASPPLRRPRWWPWQRAPRGVRGLYLWGGVGRGKTYLMNLFFDTLPLARKQRFHFHRFMQRVHAELRTLREQREPLTTVAERLAADARVICLDEFFVTDITDAMLLAGLLETLFARGVTLVTTSNIAPDDLYRDGLQRARFVPAIELLKTHTRVMELVGDTDYRRRALDRAELYLWPYGHAADARLAALFAELGGADPGHGNGAAGQLLVAGRPLAARRLGDGIAWFDFAVLCDGPRSQTDYIEIARLFHTVLLSDVPVLNHEREDPARRFLNLIDEFYDRNVKLALSAAVPIDELYQGRRLRFEFRRTRSRLQEMGSYDYLGRPHLPLG